MHQMSLASSPDATGDQETAERDSSGITAVNAGTLSHDCSKAPPHPEGEASTDQGLLPQTHVCRSFCHVQEST